MRATVMGTSRDLARTGTPDSSATGRYSVAILPDRLTSAGTWPNVRLVRFDHADEHRAQGPTFGGLEHGQDALLRRQRFRQLSIVQRFSRGRQSKHAGAAIGPVHGSLNQPSLFESVDHGADTRPVERHAFHERVLVYARRVVQMNHHTEFQSAEVVVDVHFSERAEGDLIKAARETDGCLHRRRENGALVAFAHKPDYQKMEHQYTD